MPCSSTTSRAPRAQPQPCYNPNPNPSPNPNPNPDPDPDPEQDEPRVTTFSLHCAGNFFSEKQRSDLDVEVPPGAGDDEYLALLREHLPPLFERVQPDLTFFQVQ